MSLLDHPERAAVYRTQPISDAPTWRERVFYSCRVVYKHVTKHVGVGIICAVAYFDPGNWSVDLQAGSLFGYRPMLFVILMAGLGAMVLQSLAFKLGCVTGLDLASHCRVLLHDRPRYKRLIRYGVLYPLYVLSEIAIVSTDLAELLGSAIGLCLIFPSIPLWASVLITASDVLIFLVLGDPSQGHGRPVRIFEWTVIALVSVVFICFLVLLVRVGPNWPKAFFGYIPSKALFETNPDALYTAVGILGATVMPHALFLGSYLATQDRIGPEPVLPNPTMTPPPSNFRGRLRAWFQSLFAISRAERIAASRDYRDKFGRENNELAFIRAHLSHGLVDVIVSLLAVAVPINSAILVIAATVFFKDASTASSVPAGLFDAHDLIKAHIGKAAAFIFALALLCAGQTASITATLAGQIVSEGFIEWRVSPFLRRIITRLIGLIPSVVVAIAVGRPGIDTLLVASQVALAIVLPFVAAPLIWLTSSKSVMSVRKPTEAIGSMEASSQEVSPTTPTPTALDTLPDAIEEIQLPREPGVDSRLDEKFHVTIEKHQLHDSVADMSLDEDAYISFASGWVVTSLAYLIFFIILAANVYAIVMLALGRTT
ncbi:natural resistance-associated macrophage protein [Lentinus tigrinus ALCF2SS1-7]|uniref:Natural resistance-associated macrophage protein n=1 Tax=Lentinus tigrinus ALCF2SS1-6 TaxID=1328759 RepID=A0A5C2SJA6_9APHY|nr:natural resistance-associated macrophage protein [Lentinus tigrinus ALCF2SS1-6]RPD81700.1 natural resistance-associated macrophage protein [Lentinus tigrinus ALCF2SS1-7]